MLIGFADDSSPAAAPAAVSPASCCRIRASEPVAPTPLSALASRSFAVMLSLLPDADTWVDAMSCGKTCASWLTVELMGAGRVSPTAALQSKSSIVPGVGVSNTGRGDGEGGSGTTAGEAAVVGGDMGGSCFIDFGLKACTWSHSMVGCQSNKPLLRRERERRLPVDLVGGCCAAGVTAAATD